jgi:WD40 repeat protein
LHADTNWTNRRWLGLPNPEMLLFGPDGRFWTSDGADIAVWTVPEGKQAARWSNSLAETLTGQGTPRSLCVGKQYAAVGVRDGSLAILAAADARQLCSQSLGEGPVQALAFDQDEKWAAFGTFNGTVGLVSLPDGKVHDLRKVHRDSVETIAFVGPDLIASGSLDRSVRLWRRTAGGLEEVLTLSFVGPVIRVLSTGSHLAVLVQGERAVRLWNLAKLQRELAELEH